MTSNKKIIIAAGFVCLAALAGQMVLAEDKYAGNEAKAGGENVQWEKNIEMWTNKVKTWNDRRINAHEKDFEFGDRRYCSKKGCWAEDVTNELSFSPDKSKEDEKGFWKENVSNELSFGPDRLKEEWNLYGGRDDSDILDEQGNKWEDGNSGQVLTYTGINGEFWESTNNGQVIEYKNARGDHWESGNMGQGITYRGVNGESWESANDGQTVDYTNANGDHWSGGNNGDIDYQGADGERWSGDDAKKN